MESGKPAAYYREYAPREALREHVRAFFSCTISAKAWPLNRVVTREDPVGAFCPAVFADAHVSIVVALGRPYGETIGPMTAAHPASPGPHDEAVGVYFRAARAERFTGIPTNELTDRVVSLEDLWGEAGYDFESRICEAGDDATRIGLMESVLVKRLAAEQTRSTGLDVPGLAATVLRRPQQSTVARLANAAGVSRQRLTKVFREHVGVSPKLYCRLARFRASLAQMSQGAGDWAQMSVELGYTDQSHMIAEFREFSGVTPGRLAKRQFFHPWIT